MPPDNVQTALQRLFSRRGFLETALMGATTVVHGMSYSTRAIGNADMVTAADNLADLDLHAASTLVRQKRVSPVQLAQACIARIEALNPILNAFKAFIEPTTAGIHLCNAGVRNIVGYAFVSYLDAVN